MKEKMAIAKAHALKSTVKFYGFLPWKKLFSHAIFKSRQAYKHYMHTCQKNAFELWKDHVRIQRNRKIVQECARVNHIRQVIQNKLVATAFSMWKVYISSEKAKEVKAIQHFAKKMSTKALLAWKRFTKRSKHDKELQEWEKEQVADQHAIQFTMRLYYARWRNFIEQVRATREKEQIGKELRNKIATWLEQFRLEKKIDWLHVT